MTSGQSEGGSSETVAADADVTVSPQEPPDDAPPGSDPDWTAKQTKVDPAQLLGRWQDSFFGTRILTMNADGTGQMSLNFDFAGSLLYGRQVNFDMKWTLDQGVVKVDILEGKPANAAKTLMDTWGTHHIYLLDRVERELVEMRDPEHTLSHTLRRLP